MTARPKSCCSELCGCQIILRNIHFIRYFEKSFCDVLNARALLAVNIFKTSTGVNFASEAVSINRISKEPEVLGYRILAHDMRVKYSLF